MFQPGALSGLKVVEFTDQVAGSFCARLLGDAGADVVKVEPPGGDRRRRSGPYPGGVPDLNRSGLYLYLNANKRGVCLDLDTQMPLFWDLVSGADVLVAGSAKAEIERLGLRRNSFEDDNPRLIVVVITPFGLTGPNSGYLGDELIAVAAGGLAFSTPGIPDGVQDSPAEPPLRANAYLGEFLTAVQGSVACLAALLARDLTGQGCEIDISLQEGVAGVIPFELAHAAYHEPKRREPQVFGVMPNVYLPCKDGYVVIMAVMEAHWRRLMDLAGNPGWSTSEVFGSAPERARNWDALEPLLLEWTMEHSGKEIAQMALESGIPCFPAFSVGQMVDSSHIVERQFMWEFQPPANQAEDPAFKLPGYPVRMGATPWRLRRSAPRLGEHTAEVLAEWLVPDNAALAPEAGSADRA